VRDRVGIVIAIYIIFVVLFEGVFLGYNQPKLESAGIPMLVLTTTDEAGDSSPRRLARIETDGKLYVSAHHWPRGWYYEAVANPDVQVEMKTFQPQASMLSLQVAYHSPMDASPAPGAVQPVPFEGYRYCMFEKIL